MVLDGLMHHFPAGNDRLCTRRIRWKSECAASMNFARNRIIERHFIWNRKKLGDSVFFLCVLFSLRLEWQRNVFSHLEHFSLLTGGLDGSNPIDAHV